ncbi:MAG: hypothetical protein J5685_05580 [Clostridiales bacterium]|nr:hypothetical protein [Clostridiales bacterium]
MTWISFLGRLFRALAEDQEVPDIGGPPDTDDKNGDSNKINNVDNDRRQNNG